jgi:large subunit ribosomal protein L19
MNTIKQVEQEQIAKLTEGKKIPQFSAGDTVRVNVKVVEGRFGPDFPSDISTIL